MTKKYILSFVYYEYLYDMKIRYYWRHVRTLLK